MTAPAAEVPVTRKPVSAFSRDSIRVYRRRSVRDDGAQVAPDLAGGFDWHASRVCGEDVVLVDAPGSAGIGLRENTDDFDEGRVLDLNAAK